MNTVIKIAPVLKCIHWYIVVSGHDSTAQGLSKTDRQTHIYIQIHLCACSPRTHLPPSLSRVLSSLLVLPSPPFWALSAEPQTAWLGRGENLTRQLSLCLGGAEYCLWPQLNVGTTHSLLPSAYNISGLGMSQKVGHLDFYPNGGKHMAGCQKNGLSTIIDLDGIWSGT